MIKKIIIVCILLFSLTSCSPQRNAILDEHDVNYASLAFGNPKATVVMTVFLSYQCESCKDFFLNNLQNIWKDYVDTGKVYLLIRDFPLSQDSIYPNIAVWCADEENKSREMMNMIFENQKKSLISNFEEDAKSLKLDEKSFNNCLRDSKYLEIVNFNKDFGKLHSVSATPTIFLGSEQVSFDTSEELTDLIDNKLQTK